MAVLFVALSDAGVGFLRGGFVGVDVFFVLSGFVITSLLFSEAQRRCYVSLADFYARRARRIIPAATLTLVATNLAAYHLLNHVRAKQYLQDSIPAALFGANIHFANQGTDHLVGGVPQSPLLHLWSLAVEEQFYVLWPLVLIVALGLSVLRNTPRPTALHEPVVRRLLVVIVATAVASLAWSLHDTAAHPAAAYFSTVARAWELAVGAGLALGASMLAGLTSGRRTSIGWLGLACIAVAAVAFSGHTPVPGYASLLPSVGAALVIAAGIGTIHARRGVGRVLALAPLRYVGDRSYGFYLWHWPVLVISAQYVGHNLPLGSKLLLLLAAFGLSIVSYQLFENPLRTMRSPASAGSALLFWLVSAATVLVLAVTYISSIDTQETRIADSRERTPARMLPTVFRPPARAPVRAGKLVGGTADAQRRGR